MTGREPGAPSGLLYYPPQMLATCLLIGDTKRRPSTVEKGPFSKSLVAQVRALGLGANLGSQTAAAG
jgi:hypothetical protein